MSTRHLTISLERGLAEAITRLARQETRPVSNLIAVLLTEALRARHVARLRAEGWPETARACPICGREASETPPADCPHHLV